MTLERRVRHAYHVSAMHRTTAERTDWLKADLRCLMCGRAAGYVLRPLRPVEAAGLGPDQTLQFTTFHPAESSAPPTRLIGGEQFRCVTCGGSVIVDQQETFSAYAKIDDEIEDRPRRGRPPSRWRHPDISNRIKELGITG